MNSRPAKGPQHTLIFRVVALVSRLRLNYLQSKSRHNEIIIAAYLFLAGMTALSTTPQWLI